MGRPLNKRFFGPASDGGSQIKVQFHNGTASVDGYIVKQTGSKRFVCSDGTATATCYLVDKVAAALVAGEMTVSVRDDAGVVKRLVKVAANKATAGDGSVHVWTFDGSVIDGRVEIEDAGGSGDPIPAAQLRKGSVYRIVSVGTTDFTAIGSADNVVDTEFTATGKGKGTGTAVQVEDTFGL